MKRFLILVVSIVSITSVGYSQRESMSPDSKSIIRLIDATVRYAIENKVDFTNQSQMAMVASDRARTLGYSTDPNFQRYDFSGYSNQFKEKLNVLLQSTNYETKEEYISALNNAISDAGTSSMTTSEKNTLIFNLSLMVGVLNYGEEIFNSNPYAFLNNYQQGFGYANQVVNCRYGPFADPDDYLYNAKFYLSWWKRWGRCLAGILGGSISGGVTGGTIGAAVGTATLPLVGTVSLGVVGTVGGVISGGLTGAVNSCYRGFGFPAIAKNNKP